MVLHATDDNNDTGSNNGATDDNNDTSDNNDAIDDNNDTGGNNGATDDSNDTGGNNGATDDNNDTGDNNGATDDNNDTGSNNGATDDSNDTGGNNGATDDNNDNGGNNGATDDNNDNGGNNGATNDKIITVWGSISELVLGISVRNILLLQFLAQGNQNYKTLDGVNDSLFTFCCCCSQCLVTPILPIFCCHKLNITKTQPLHRCVSYSFVLSNINTKSEANWYFRNHTTFLALVSRIAWPI